MTQYVILAIVLIIFFGLWLYLWTLDRRVSKLISEVNAEQDDNEVRSVSE